MARGTRRALLDGVLGQSEDLRQQLRKSEQSVALVPRHAVTPNTGKPGCGMYGNVVLFLYFSVNLKPF